jgi:hypothetical protein
MRPRSSVNHPPTSEAEVKRRVELYLYNLTGPLLPVVMRTFKFAKYI